MAGLRISCVMRLPVATSLRIIPTYGHLHLNERGGPSTPDDVATARAHPASLPDAVIGASYRAVVAIEGGVLDLFSLAEESALPAGLSLDAQSGSVFGAPTGPTATASFTVVAIGGDGQRARQQFTLCVVEGRLATRALPPAIAGRPYSATLDSGNLAQPASWRVVDGALPPWLSLRISEDNAEPDTARPAWCLRGFPPADGGGGASSARALHARGAPRRRRGGLCGP